MIEIPVLTAEEAARRDAFVGRLIQAFIEGGNLVTVYIGDRLGLYQALAELRPPHPLNSPHELARTSGIPGSGWSNRLWPASLRSPSPRQRP